MSDLLLRLLYVAAVDWAALDRLGVGALSQALDAQHAFKAAALGAGVVAVREARMVDFELALRGARSRAWTSGASRTARAPS